MTKAEFQQWWYVHDKALTKVAEEALAALQCHDPDIAVTIILSKLETYLERTCDRYGAGGLAHIHLWHICIQAIKRRARNHIRNSIRTHGQYKLISMEDIAQQQQNPDTDDRSADYSHFLTRAELSYTMDTDVIEQQRVRLVLAAMSLKDRDLLLCTIVEGWTIEDVSKKMGYAHRTGAQAAISRAKERFRRIWYQKGYGGDIPQIATGDSPSCVSKPHRKT